MTRLAPCLSCNRHVRATEALCPFCSAALEPGAVLPRVVASTRGLKRAALFALSATAVASACGAEGDDKDNTMQPSMSGTVTASSGTSSATTPGAGGMGSMPSSEPSIQPLYGAPIDVGGGGAGSMGSNEPLPQPVYGAPIEPAGAGGASDDGTDEDGQAGSSNIKDPGGVGVALYGAPIAPDATE